MLTRTITADVFVAAILVLILAGEGRGEFTDSRSAQNSTGAPRCCVCIGRLQWIVCRVRDCRGHIAVTFHATFAVRAFDASCLAIFLFWSQKLGQVWRGARHD